MWYRNSFLNLAGRNDTWMTLQIQIHWIPKVLCPLDPHQLYISSKYFPLPFFFIKKKLKHCLISCCCFDEAYLPLQNYQWKGLFHHNHSLYQLDPAGDPSDVCGAFHPENKANDISYEKQGINVLKSTKHKALEGQSFRELIVLLSWMLPWRLDD